MKKLLAFLTLLTMASCVQGAAWGDPTGFFDQEKIESKQLSAGVTWISASGKKWGSPFQIQIITVDLQHPNVSLRMLSGSRFLSKKPGHFVARSTISQYLKDGGALAAINIPFFEIASSQMPFGLLMIDRKLLREPSPHYPSFLYTADKRLVFAAPNWAGFIRHNSQKRPLTAINRSALSGDEIVLYTDFWTRSPGHEAPFLKERKTREILLETASFQPAKNQNEDATLVGRVVEIRDDGKSFPIAKGQFVLAAAESAIPFFRHVKQGQTIEVGWRLTDLPASVEWQDITNAGAGSPILLHEGKRQHGTNSFWKTRHPRSALAVNDTGDKVLLIVVDGRSKKSAGMNLEELTDFIAHLGAWNALNVDGGGSSALGARVDEVSRILNVPSDGTERNVPVALGVFDSSASP